MNEAINGSEPAFSGDALSYFQGVHRDRTLPTELRLVAARCAAQFERPTMRSNGASYPDVRGGLAERPGDARARLDEPTTRRERIRELVGKLGYTLTIEDPRTNGFDVRSRSWSYRRPSPLRSGES